MPPSEQAHSFQAPKGTRDFYPQDLLKKRYIEKMWRDTSIRHGFDEIDGPTFEHLDLYTVKSGEGIISELFSFRREGGEKDYALRPEFTPTLARMYASKAGSLPKPTKWFWQQNCYRAEKPQRGRLREFGQWNVDLIGGVPEGASGEEIADAKAQCDVDLVSCLVDFLRSVGLSKEDVVVRFNSREMVDQRMDALRVPQEHRVKVMNLIDAFQKTDERDIAAQADKLGVPVSTIKELAAWPAAFESPNVVPSILSEGMAPLLDALDDETSDWLKFDPSIVRGLAYYTGMVFEVHESGGKERTIAGGGRYDKLIEMFGGPPTPAVGFGMGDVVLSLVLQDRGLLPEGAALLAKLDEPPASYRPEVFVISNGQPESDAALRPLVAGLRRGGDGQRPLHARHTYKTTKNVGKLLQEAASSHARFAAIIENGQEASLKDLVNNVQMPGRVPLAQVSQHVSK